MAKKVYIETSVVSYLTARPSRNILAAAWQQLTQDWWEKQGSRFELFILTLVMAEAGEGDPDAVKRRVEMMQGIPDLEVTDDVVALAKKLIDEGALPREALDDAMHVALATVHGVDYLLTWNCRHIDNAERKPLIRSVCAVAGYICPEICTPQELMGEEDA
ncbi:MAG: type II toxin-antitoxin system VapC family toxin [Planctomycetota bacterium]|jgi:predicted nucleic acid-binding protein